MVKPYNIVSITQPYMHLLDDSVMKQKSYVAGVTNPIYKSMTKKWDFYCDIESGEIIQSEFMNEPLENKMLVIDKIFIRKVVLGILTG